MIIHQFIPLQVPEAETPFGLSKDADALEEPHCRRRPLWMRMRKEVRFYLADFMVHRNNPNSIQELNSETGHLTWALKNEQQTRCIKLVFM